MKKIKGLAILLAMTLTMPILASCGDKDDSGDKITLKLWNGISQDAKEEDKIKYEQSMAELKEKFPNVEFISEIAPVGSDYRQEYDKALMAGTAPAIYTQFSYTDIPTRIDNGTIADITKYVENWQLKKEGKVLDIMDDAIQKDGKWYAIPRDAYIKATLCNTKVYGEAGGDVTNFPKTWDEFAEAGSEVTDLSVPRFGYALMGMDWCAWPYTTWVWSAGGEMVRKNGDGTYKIAFNEDAGVDAAMFLHDMIWKYKMTQKDVLIDIDNLNLQMMNGSACFAFQALSDLNADRLAEYGLKYTDYIDVPTPVKDSSITPRAMAGGEVITFNPKLTEEELSVAFEVAEYMYLSDKAMQGRCDYVKENGIADTKILPRVDWQERFLQASGMLTDAQIAASKKIAENPQLEPFCPHWSDLKSQLVAPLQKIYLTENVTSEEAKKLLDDCAEKLYELYPETFKR